MPGRKQSRIRRQTMDARLFLPAIKYKEKVYPGVPYVIENRRPKKTTIWGQTHADIIGEITDPESKFVDYKYAESGFVPSPRLPQDFLSRKALETISGKQGETYTQQSKQEKALTTEEAKRITRNYKPTSPRLEYPTLDNINFDRVKLKRDLNKTFHRLRRRQNVLQSKGKDISGIKRDRYHLREMAKALGILGIGSVYLGQDD